MKEYQAWLHCEDMLDEASHAAFPPRVEQEWQERYAAKDHDAMSLTPAYLAEEAALRGARTICDARDEAGRAE
eukprot:8645560-Heterocapsa_arctica.AAC.1